MTLPDQDGASGWIGRTVVDRNGAEIGVCTSLLADTTTGQPEWLCVDRDEVTLIVPLLEAEQRRGRVHVTVTRAYADGAPRFGPTEELSRDQEAALYRHYGIEYSTAASDSILPAGAQPTTVPPVDAGNDGPAPEAPSRPAGAPDAARGRGVAAAVAVLLALTAAVVAAVRLRRGAGPRATRLLGRGAPPPRPAARRALALKAAAGPVVEASGRLVRRGASEGTALVRRAAVDAAHRSRAASTTARTYTDVAAARLAPLLATTGRAAWSAVRAGTDSVLQVTDAATEAVVAALPQLAAGAARGGRRSLQAVLTVGAAAEAVPEVVADAGERLEKGWRRAMSRLSLGLGFGVGYVLGARAGRARYEQIRQAAADVMERPEVRRALDKASTAAPGPLRESIDKLTRRGSPGGGTGAPAESDNPLPDPLIPPAKSGDDPAARP